MLETWEIRRPLPSLSLGWAAGGITAGVRHWLWPGHVCCQPRLLPAASIFAAHAFAKFLAMPVSQTSPASTLCPLLATSVAKWCWPHSWPPFALCLVSVVKWCFYGVSYLPDGILHSGLKNHPAASTLCRTCFCHVPGHACRLSFSSFHPLGLTEFQLGQWPQQYWLARWRALHKPSPFPLHSPLKVKKAIPLPKYVSPNLCCWRPDLTIY